MIFFSQIDSTLLSKWTVPPSPNFLCKLGLPGILLIFLSYPFLDHTNCSHYYWYDGSFKVPYFIMIIISPLASFSHLQWLMILLWNFRDSKYPRVSRTLHSILADFNNVGPDSSSDFQFLQSLSSQPFGTFQSAPLTVGIPDTLMFHNFFVLWPGLSICLAFFIYFIFSLLILP